MVVGSAEAKNFWAKAQRWNQNEEELTEKLIEQEVGNTMQKDDTTSKETHEQEKRQGYRGPVLSSIVS